ncbi:carbonic anhydrase family protein [Roseibium sp. FZY0029]|uniref:carbonic anhydrase n=1 Tax=Roseibium sp. FZY0029 TaxID=3116647 RepID=UPI002E982CC2|nr:carbonic anhydrase family protein [Roseibium sp. FZY0029]
MNIRILLTAAAAIAFTSSAMAATPQHWSYEGAGGPTHWGALSAKFAACESGMEQSPVDLTHAVKADPADIEFHWNKDADWTVVNNGHSIQANSDDAGYIVLDGKDYKLAQFHFHTPSEHAIDGKRFPMEVHFVNVADDGEFAVIGAMIEGGGDNTLFDAVMDAAPAKEGGSAEIGKEDPASLLGQKDSFFRYEGSLTTPPCSQTVVWTIMKEPLKVSDAEIKKFQGIYQMNARPLQEIGRRFILEQ